jgi:para-aminobenzoate synthetase component 1
VRELPAGLTPLAALEAVEETSGTLFLETGGERVHEREWAFLAFDPLWRLTLSGGALWRSGLRLAGSPLDALRAAWPRPLAVEPDPAVPFAGGLAGYLSYDFKDALHRYPRRAPRGSGLPDLVLGYYDVVWSWERGTGRGWVIATGPDGADRERRAGAARERLAAQWERVTRGGRGAAPGGAARPPRAGHARNASGSGSPRIASNFTRTAYRETVRRALEHIAAGNIYQVNLAQRFLVAPSPAPAALFRRLREAAPAPFAALVALDEGGIASSSPERFFRIEGDRIETWPIKGTRPRGRTPEEDAALARELRSSEKDRAENVMIVDLERNDLGRICRTGSVAVPSLCAVESFSNVHHLVSRVEGRLNPAAAPVDILAAMFPGGSVTGTPKIRAVGIIDELEPVRRGVFTGAIGYWDRRGGCDWNLAIRTVVVERGTASFHVGGGIVADSSPDAEYEETLAKAAGMMGALGVRWEG